MMIGVAQVIGTKPIANSFFSSGPVLSTASALAAPSGKTLDSEESTAPRPEGPQKLAPGGSGWKHAAQYRDFHEVLDGRFGGYRRRSLQPRVVLLQATSNQDARTMGGFLQERDQTGLSGSAGITEERSA